MKFATLEKLICKYAPAFFFSFTTAIATQALQNVYYMGDSAEFWFLYRPVTVCKSLVPCSHSEAMAMMDGPTTNHHNKWTHKKPTHAHYKELKLSIPILHFFTSLFLLNVCSDQRFLITICSLISSLSLTSQHIGIHTHIYVNMYMRETFLTNISTKLRLSNVSAAGDQVISWERCLCCALIFQ